MFRITKDPSSGSFIQCLDKNYINGSMSSVDMDLVCVMVLLCNVYTHTHTHTHIYIYIQEE